MVFELRSIWFIPFLKEYFPVIQLPMAIPVESAPPIVFLQYSQRLIKESIFGVLQLLSEPKNLSDLKESITRKIMFVVM